ncbi:MAG: carbohydrate binding family 9 domain-containing protein [Bacteroidota bacterium]|nr:carbohydrate binding family 9 domain-containing protein [Bacteroidota bacterium]
MLFKNYRSVYKFNYNLHRSISCKIKVPSISLLQISLLFFIICSLSSKSWGQEPEITDIIQKKEIQAFKLLPQHKIILDGVLDEVFWELVQPAEDFLQQEPLEGAPATEQTVVRVAYDRKNLYIGVILYDSDPSGIKAFQKRRDAGLGTDDRFMFFLDTFEDGRNAYFFEINPAGLLGDGLIRVGQGSNVNKAWDGIWRPWVKKGNYGWSAEIKIPFQTLDFNPEKESWGINFQRTVRRKNEESLWTGHRRNQGIFRPQDGGRLVGLQGLSQGIGLEVNPYAITSHNRNTAGDAKHSNTRWNMGFDASYNITTNLRAAITVNTDFAETAVDQRQVNLTRFPLFFPELRNFFLEAANIFEFAPSSNVYPFFSRSIGLVGGNPIPISYGGRLAGRIANLNVGMLHVRTAALDTIPAEDFSVGRITKNIFSESNFGIIYTRRATHDTQNSFDGLQDRHTIGADLELNTSRFMGKNNLQFQAFFVINTPEYQQDTYSWTDRTARGVRLSFPNQPWSGHVSYRELDVAFDPAAGFTPRRAFRRLQPTIAYSPLLPKSSLLREVTFGIHHEHLMDMDFKPATINTRLTILGLHFESGDRFNISVNRNFEMLDFYFDIKRDQAIIIAPGNYTNRSFTVDGSTAPFRRIVTNFYVTREGFWSGRRNNYGGGLTFRPLTGFNVHLNWDHSQIVLHEGAFDTHIFRLSADVDLTPWISWSNFAQYDNLTRLIGLNSRFRWIVRPGSDVFLVYNHNWINTLEQIISLESQATLKATYTHRF